MPALPCTTLLCAIDAPAQYAHIHAWTRYFKAFRQKSPSPTFKKNKERVRHNESLNEHDTDPLEKTTRKHNPCTLPISASVPHMLYVLICLVQVWSPSGLLDKQHNQTCGSQYSRAYSISEAVEEAQWLRSVLLKCGLLYRALFHGPLTTVDMDSLRRPIVATLRFLQPLPSSQIRQGELDRTSDSES